MKKLLSIFILALALCLLCGVALAEHPLVYYPEPGDHENPVWKNQWISDGGVLEHWDHTHDYVHWNDGFYTKLPTCTETGEYVYECDYPVGNGEARHAHTIIIKPLGHFWSSEKENNKEWGRVTVEPTCTESGEAINYCIVETCEKHKGATQEDADRDGIRLTRKIDKLGHGFDIPDYRYWKWDICAMPNCLNQEKVGNTIVYHGRMHQVCTRTNHGVVCNTIKLKADGTHDDLYPTLEEMKNIFQDEDFPGQITDYDPHQWTEWVKDREATCYVPETWTRMCSLCDKFETKVTKNRLDPVFVRVDEKSELLSCFQEKVFWRCKNCESKASAEGLPVTANHKAHWTLENVTAHTYDHVEKYEVAPSKVATCTEAGYKNYRCVFSRLSYKEYELVSNVTGELRVIATPVHGDTPTDKVDLPALNHMWTKWTRVVNGGDDGKFNGWVRTCLRKDPPCNKKEQEVSVEKPKCGPNYHADAEEQYMASTCTKDGYSYKVCPDCGEMYDVKVSETDKLHHTWVEDKVVHEATCTEEGSQVYVCKCGANKIETLKAKGHTKVNVEAKAATCAEAGNTAGEKCTVCDYTTVEEIKATGNHDFTKVLPAVAATCTKTGLTAGTECSVCGKDALAQKEIPALGHDINVLPAVAATCTEDGKTEGKDCTRCDDATVEVKQEVIPAKDHTWDEGKITTEQTAETNAVKTYTCTVCKETKTETLGHTHVFKDEVVKEPTCEGTGYEMHSCIHCDYNETEVLPAKGHTEEVIAEVKPTCAKTGLTAGKKCSVCGEITVKQEEIAATGEHTYAQVAGKDATCTEAGLTVGVECSVCKDVILAQTEIKALGHDIKVLAAKDPTCTETGLTKGMDCSRCDAEDVKQEEIPALGHKWDEGKITTEATPTTDGVKTFTCTVCKETKTEKVAYVFGDEAKYTLTNMSFSNSKITGTVVHDATTVESDKLYARVTVFFNGGTYAVFADYVVDGVIDIEVQGVVLAVSVNLTGTKNLVPGEDVKVFDSWGNYSK